MLGWSSRPGLAIAVVTFLVVGSLGLMAGVSPTFHPVPSEQRDGGLVSNPVMSPTKVSPSFGSSSPSPASHVTEASAVKDGPHARENSLARAHLPDPRRRAPNQHGPIEPVATQAPAPMGVADIGLRNESGVLVPYELNTTSVAGTVNITNLQSIYVDGDGPDTYGIQLNSVVNGVTIFGNSSYEFWAQNYGIYSISTHQLNLQDEVWNFSNPANSFPQNSIYFGSNGTYEASPFPPIWQGLGPTLTIGYPFTLTLYSNTSLIGDRPALYFNYTLSNSTFRESASFDDLIFNSTVGTPTRAATLPYYQADGFQYDPAGLINDMEITILGNCNGDTTSFTAADATVSLQYWNATAEAMQEVPSAFNAGQETGETSVGLMIYSSGGANPVAMVRSGPSFVGGLWNYSAQNGAVADTVTVHPAAEYSFLFVNVGSSENASAAQWVPTSTGGTTTFYLPTGGTYFLEFMMSNYDPATRVVTATHSATLLPVFLAPDPTIGIYTPLFAFTNAELASISSAGAGTVGNPYILINDQYASLAPQFAMWNDFQYPQFPGLLIAGTTAYAEVTPPSFEINLPSWDFAAPSVAALGLPLTNNLQLQFYDASNVELVHTGGILGWLSAVIGSWPLGSAMFWNCTNSLVLSNTFDDQGNALLFYGGTNNVVWGNTFVTTAVVAADPSSVEGSGGWDTGINETESGDLIYNNQFEVGIPAITVTYDPFVCFQYEVCPLVSYNDTWNVTMQPASNYTLVDGWNLTGSIIGTDYQGGNYWSNYGTSSNPYGVLPYNDSASITVGGDYVPLVPFALYTVTFTESGLPSGGSWSVLESGREVSSLTPQVVVTEPNGTYPVSFTSEFGWLPLDPPLEFTVNGTAVAVSVSFVQSVYLVDEADYLSHGAPWSVTINGLGTENVPLTLHGTSIFSPVNFINVTLPEGRYSVSAAAPGYICMTPPFSATIVPPSYGLTFVFEPIPGTIGISVTPADASVWVNGSKLTVLAGQASWTGTPGWVPVEALAVGYYPYFTNVSAVSGTTVNLTIALKPIEPGTLTLTVTPGSAYTYVDGNLVALTGGVYSASIAPGLHSVVVVAAGYYTYYNNLTVTSQQTTNLTIALIAVSSPSSAVAGISTPGWGLIGLLAALAVIFLVAMVYFARRGRSGGSPPVTPPPQPWQETPPGYQPPPT